MSKYSLPNPRFVRLLIVALAVLDVTGAHAQTRTPTSPLDRPEEPQRQSEPQRVEVGVAPAPTQLRPPRIALPAAGLTSAPAPIALDELLPEGVSVPSGLTPALVVARTTQVGLATRSARARSEASEAALRFARRGFVPRTSASLRYTRLSAYTPATISAFDTPRCLEDIAACQANPNDYVSSVVLQRPILDQYAMSVGITVPVSDYLGVARHELDAARLERDAALESERGAQDDEVLDGLETYFELVRARAQQRLAEDAASLASTRAVEARARLEHGLVNDAAVLEAEASEQAHARLLRVAETRVSVAERALRDLLELDDDAPVELAVELAALPQAPTGDLDTLRATARAQDPGVRASLLRAEAQRSRAKAERARMFPQLSVALSYLYANPNQRIFPQTTEFIGTWDVVAQLSYSLDGSMLAGARRQQRAALAEESMLTAENDARRAGRVVIDAQGRVVAALAEVEAQRLATATATLRERDASERRHAGLATDADLRDASASALRARLDLVDAVVDAHLARARLARALGGAPSADAATR